MREVLVLQHAAVETLGAISGALDGAGLDARYVRTHEGERVPELGDAAGLVVLGGPMGAYERDRYPHLRDEMRLIERALSAGRPALGVCLGSQLLAAALGAGVREGGYKEIGWYPVELTAAAADDPLWSGVPSPFTAFHWHGDVFELPAGAVPLASSERTPLQAFRYGPNAYGLLFHPEVTEPIVEGMLRQFSGELREEGLDGREIAAAGCVHLVGLRRVADRVFGGWAALAAGRTLAAKRG